MSDLSDYIETCETTSLEYQLLKDSYKRDIKEMQPLPLWSVPVAGALGIIIGIVLTTAVNK